MKNEKPDNPPAFPNPIERQTDGNGEGMTLLDYFAAKAMNGNIVDAGQYGSDWKLLAIESYEAAQAMLKERQKHL